MNASALLVRSVAGGWLPALVTAVWLLGSAGAAQAENAAPQDASVPRSASGAAAGAAPGAAPGAAAGALPGSADTGPRMDRQIEALTATGYQTALVAAAAGGVVLAGMAVGTHAAVIVGTAVVVGYLFLPWE